LERRAVNALTEPLRAFVRARPALHSGARIARDLNKFLAAPTRDRVVRMRTIAKVYQKTMLPPARLFNICDVVERINDEGIDGDIAECGVWSGGSIALFALWDMRDPRSSRRYVAFDSFEGLPPPTAEDEWVFETFNANSKAKGRKITSALENTGVCVGDSADSVRQFFAGIGIPMQRCRFYVGWFQETTPVAARELERLAVLRIDGDWYESTRVCLDNLYGKVAPGGFVIIDDYGCFPGCRKAVDEFRDAEGLRDPLVWVDEHCVWFRKPLDSRLSPERISQGAP
jgi:hypothetical protein